MNHPHGKPLLIWAGVLVLLAPAFFLLATRFGYSSEPGAPFIYPDTLHHAGHKLFVHQWSEQEGLGPFFNQNSCVACHNQPNPGGGGTRIEQFAVHVERNKRDSTGTFYPKFHLTQQGLDTIPLHSTARLRRPQTLYTIASLDAISDTTILQLADAFDLDNDGITGRAIQTSEGVGRYGWKGRIARLNQFVRIAFQNEMGITDDEIDSNQIIQTVQLLHDLNEVNRYEPTTDFSEGRSLFNQLGCGFCHMEQLPDSNGKPVYTYSDLLVHDMGKILDEGFDDGEVKGPEFRTALLTNLGRTPPPYLHDGSAANLRQAIEKHGGEATTSIRAWHSLSNGEQKDLLKFLRNL
ncbi:MAG: hypothetical protein JJ975_10770 [Bacteroidia bacterium]|nr:hypothetical protein [Bacteroidia bacterium]